MLREGPSNTRLVLVLGVFVVAGALIFGIGGTGMFDAPAPPRRKRKRR
jgi:hypothetical protein